jgi:hypothetical protein
MVTLFTLVVAIALPLMEEWTGKRETDVNVETDFSWLISVMVAIRSLRIVRAFRFLSFIDKNATLITSIVARSIAAAMTILMVLFSFTYVYAIIGIHYYKGAFTMNNKDLEDTSYMGNTFGAVDQRCYATDDCPECFDCSYKATVDKQSTAAHAMLLEGEVKYLMGVTFEVGPGSINRGSTVDPVDHALTPLEECSQTCAHVNVVCFAERGRRVRFPVRAADAE